MFPDRVMLHAKRKTKLSEWYKFPLEWENITKRKRESREGNDFPKKNISNLSLKWYAKTNKRGLLYSKRQLCRSKAVFEAVTSAAQITFVFYFNWDT